MSDDGFVVVDGPDLDSPGSAVVVHAASPDSVHYVHVSFPSDLPEQSDRGGGSSSAAARAVAAPQAPHAPAAVAVDGGTLPHGSATSLSLDDGDGDGDGDGNDFNSAHPAFDADDVGSLASSDHPFSRGQDSTRRRNDFGGVLSSAVSVGAPDVTATVPAHLAREHTDSLIAPASPVSSLSSASSDAGADDTSRYLDTIDDQHDDSLSRHYTSQLEYAADRGDHGLEPVDAGDVTSLSGLGAVSGAVMPLCEVLRLLARARRSGVIDARQHGHLKDELLDWTSRHAGARAVGGHLGGAHAAAPPTVGASAAPVLAVLSDDEDDEDDDDGVSNARLSTAPAPRRYGHG